LPRIEKKSENLAKRGARKRKTTPRRRKIRLIRRIQRRFANLVFATLSLGLKTLKPAPRNARSRLTFVAEAFALGFRRRDGERRNQRRRRHGVNVNSPERDGAKRRRANVGKIACSVKQNEVERLDVGNASSRKR
jgi:hypothetical protein